MSNMSTAEQTKAADTDLLEEEQGTNGGGEGAGEKDC